MGRQGSVHRPRSARHAHIRNGRLDRLEPVRVLATAAGADRQRAPLSAAVLSCGTRGSASVDVGGRSTAA